MLQVALIGASEHPDSLAFKLFTRLRESGFELTPINPNYQTIAGVKCFASLSELKIPPEVVIFMVNPKLTLQILPQVVALNIKKVWLQPETFNDEVLAYCQEHDFIVEHEKCLLIAPPEHLTAFAA